MDKTKIEQTANQILKLIEHLDYDLQLAILKNAKQRVIESIEVNGLEQITWKN